MLKRSHIKILVAFMFVIIGMSLNAKAEACGCEGYSTLGDGICSSQERAEGLCTEVFGFSIEVCPRKNGQWPIIHSNKLEFRYVLSAPPHAYRGNIRISQVLTTCPAAGLGDLSPGKYVIDNNSYGLLPLGADIGSCNPTRPVDDASQLIFWEKFQFKCKHKKKLKRQVFSVFTKKFVGVSCGNDVIAKVGRSVCTSGKILGPGCIKIPTAGIFQYNFKDSDGTQQGIRVEFDACNPTAAPLVTDEHGEPLQPVQLWVIEVPKGEPAPEIEGAIRVQKFGPENGCTFEANPRYYGYGGSGYRR